MKPRKLGVSAIFLGALVLWIVLPRILQWRHATTPRVSSIRDLADKSLLTAAFPVAPKDTSLVLPSFRKELNLQIPQMESSGILTPQEAESLRTYLEQSPTYVADAAPGKYRLTLLVEKLLQARAVSDSAWNGLGAQERARYIAMPAVARMDALLKEHPHLVARPKLSD